MLQRSAWLRTALFLCAFHFTTGAWALGFTTVDHSDWDETAVRKVLQTFAYGGFASDRQIKDWSRLSPEAAIVEILSFNPLHDKLSPAQDSTGLYADSLESLQDFWSSERNDNPVRPDQRANYHTLVTLADGSRILSSGHLQRTWVQAATTRGVNPFLTKTGLYLTNYHMSLSVSKTEAALMRAFYDQAIQGLIQDKPLFDILIDGASSAAVARAYGHLYSTFNNNNGVFRGNDDFAREFHQLFFKIQGASDPNGADHHENVTIENTARLLTGMNVDLVPNAYGSDLRGNWFIAPINFSDHYDGEGRYIRNYTLHHRDCLYILLTDICGNTADEKLRQLGQVAGYNRESLDNLPLAIINFFADDNFNAQKITQIREAWEYTEPKSLLSFLRSYAISTTFHRADTVKYRSSFDRNLTVHNSNTLSNQEIFARNELPIGQLNLEGATVFMPAHDVFGGQTGLQAANNPNIFRDAYQRNVKNPYFITRTDYSYTDATGVQQTWSKDWAAVIPTNGDNQYEVNKVAKWLWQRFVGDGGKNYGFYERLAVESLLATGYDFGYLADPNNPELSYTKQEIEDNGLMSIVEDNEKVLMDLNSDDPVLRKRANARVGLAVNFIAATPFVYAVEGK